MAGAPTTGSRLGLDALRQIEAYEVLNRFLQGFLNHVSLTKPYKAIYLNLTLRTSVF